MLTIEQIKYKSAKKLEGLNPIVRAKVEELIVRCWAARVQIVVVQGKRDSAYQAQLYAQGRTAPGPVVTNAAPGHSFHEYGLAVDFALLRDSGAVSWSTTEDLDRDGQRDWMEVVAISHALGFVWGGNFRSIVDMPHLEYTFGLAIKDLLAGKCPPTTVAQAAAAKPVAVTTLVNGNRVKDGFIKDGRALVALRAVAEAAGHKVASTPAGVTIDGKLYTAGDELVVDWTTYVPIRSLAAVLNAAFAFDNTSKTATLKI